MTRPMTCLSRTLRALALSALACALQAGGAQAQPAQSTLPASLQPGLASGNRPGGSLGAALGGHADSATGAPSAVVQTAQVRAELLALAPDGVQPGATLWLGLQLTHQPHWHTYWKNPGDSGLPTELHWTLPGELQAGDIAWPAPQRINVGNLTNFGYEGTVLLPVPVTVGQDFAPGADASELVVRLTASWLVCAEECVPQDGSFELRLPLRGSTALHAAEFAQARQAVPQTLGGAAELHLDASSLQLRVGGLPPAWRGKALDAYIETPNVIDTPHSPASHDALSHGEAAHSGTQNWDSDGHWSVQLPLSELRDSAPTRLAFVLRRGSQSLRLEAPVQGSWPALPAPGQTPATAPTIGNSPPQVTGADVAAGPAPAGADTGSRASSGAGLLPMLLGALLGGLLLNLMPCVFPVLAIKVLAFSKNHGPGAGSHRAQGVAYSVGVVLSFLALGSLLLGLRAAGEELGWGFQLQSPAVLGALALLFTLIGMNLMGWLEIGQLLPGRLANLQLRHPVGDAFLSGVLAVAIASPCTAPFMGASLGYAMTLQATAALAIFAAIGLGLALPYLLASWFPGVQRCMPRPGIWMDNLRRFMAFPMWATVIWLLWVLGHINGVDGAFALLAVLLTVAWLVWSLGLRDRSRSVFATLALLSLLALVQQLHGTILRQPDNTVEGAADTGAKPNASLRWDAWTPERVAAELGAGKPVFVDFTAAWCITCQYNERGTLRNADVQADFHSKQVTLLRADWTRRDPLIARTLGALGRDGVPVYVLYQPGRAPHVLSEVLSVSALREALGQL